MILHYFKQAWLLFKLNRLFSFIYVTGTAMGIAMVMVMAILNYVKTADLYPEFNRSRLMYAKTVCLTPVDTAFKSVNSGRLSFKATRLFFMPLVSPEMVSVMMTGSDYASLPNDDNLTVAKSRYVDTAYWEVFRFRFLSGRPFSDADFRSGLPAAVIAESLAMRLFGSTDVTGRYFEYGFKPCRIAGVVKDVPYVMGETYAQIWMPYTYRGNYDAEDAERDGMIGDVERVYLLARSPADFAAIRSEVEEKVRRHNAGMGVKWVVDLMGQPDVQSTVVHRFWSNTGPDMRRIRIQNLFVVFLLLLVPALNLSGMNSTRMERRLGEMGVRKAFGASRLRLALQVLTENLLLTGLGGGAGLLLSYLILVFARSWIFDMGKSLVDPIPEGTPVDISGSMLLNGRVFVTVLFVCFVMNILSALIPVYRSLRRQITDSLYIKYN
jgi:putative ABC transport system permease protein